MVFKIYDYYFKSSEEDNDFRSYLAKRNIQVAHFASMGATWAEIADCMGLSRDYVKSIAHKQEAYFEKPRRGTAEREAKRREPKKYQLEVTPDAGSPAKKNVS